MTLNVKQQDAANVVWAAEAAEVGRTGSRGAQSPKCRRLAKLSVVEDTRHEERSTL